jgi:hypothetical protein
MNILVIVLIILLVLVLNKHFYSQYLQPQARKRLAKPIGWHPVAVSISG